MRTLLILIVALTLFACQQQQEEPEPKGDAQTVKSEPSQAPVVTPEEKAEIEAQAPPTPPIREDFQAAPQLSLFPRAGAFRPEKDDTEGLQFWRTYIEHLLRTSGPVREGDDENANVAFSFRAIKGLDSVGIFSPIAVQPDTSYALEATLSCDLVEGASAGIGILEFNRFLWIGEQYPESLVNEAQTGTRQLVSLTGKQEKSKQQLQFTTGPETRMVHLVFFRDGEHDRKQVVIDDIRIEEIENEEQEVRY